MNRTSEDLTSNARAAQPAASRVWSNRLDRMQTLLESAGAAICLLARRMPLRFSLVAVLLLQTLAFILLRPSYDTIDDVLLTMVASGKGISLAPDQHLIFSNVLIGYVLKWLYTQAPSIPWYGLYLLAVHFAAMSAILYCVLTIGRSNSESRRIGLRLSLYLLCFGLVELQFLTRMQFTTTGFVAGLGGIFLLLLAWQRYAAHDSHSNLGLLTAAVLFLVISGMIRLESLVMALLTVSPVIIWFAARISPRAILHCGIAVTTAAVLLAGAVAFDHSTYENDPLWRGYRSLNQLRGNFHDSSWTYYSPATSSIFNRVGWSKNDHAMIARWFSDDPQLYSAAKLQTIVDAYPWKSSQRFSGRWWTAFCNIARNRAVLAILFALPLVLLVVPGGRSSQTVILVAAITAIPLIAAVIWFKKVPPERVYLPLMSAPLFAALLSFAWRDEPNSRRHANRAWSKHIRSWWIWSAWRRIPTRREIAGTLLVIALFMGVYRQCRQAVRVQYRRVAMQRFLNEVRSHSRGLIVMWEAALPLDLVSPLDSLDWWSNNPMLSLAWPQRTPWQEDIKRRFGIENVARSLCEGNDTILIATDEHRSLLKRFAIEHFGMDIQFVTIRKSADQLVAGRFQCAEPPVSTATKAAEVRSDPKLRR
ncbi:MAG TPA: hypothetical protein VHE81_20610 [Lacipirellulaceae bacterium]|nr:hypothetical protein [Lacipirellulaceae bacterium]